MKENAVISREWVDGYFRTYNSGDFKKTVSTYYADDVIFEFPAGKFEGSEATLGFLEFVHRNMDETMTLENLIIEGDRMALQVDVKLVFTEDVPDFFLKPVKKGEVLNTRLGAFYKTKGGKVSHLTIYEFGVPK